MTDGFEDGSPHRTSPPVRSGTAQDTTALGASRRRRVRLLLFSVLLVVGVVSIAFGETIPIRSGLGVDGSTYGQWAKDFRGQVFGKGLSGYEIQRIFPSAVVHFGLRAVGAALDDHNVVLGFRVFDLAVMVLALFLWTRVSGSLSLSLSGEVRGALFLFGSFALLKNPFYYPVLTDTAAFALGMVAVWAYLTRRTAILVLATLIGAFTWPIIVYLGAWLLIFPFEPETGWRSDLDSRWVNESRRRQFLLAAGIASGLLLVAVVFLYLIRNLDPVTYSPISRALLPFSMVASGLYIGVVVYSLLTLLPFRLPAAGRHDLVMRAAAAAALVVVVRAATFVLAMSDRTGSANSKRFLLAVVLTSVQKPLVFLVAHITYYGPFVLVLLLFWKPFLRALSRFGLGFVGVAGLALVLALDSESRALIFVVPLFVTVLAVATDRYPWGRNHYLALVASSVLFSKLWLPINVGPACNDRARDEVIAHVCVPRYFLNLGPWMKLGPYVVQGAGTVVVGALLLYLLRSPSSTAMRAPGPEDEPVAPTASWSGRARAALASW